MELRQLDCFFTLARELHFGRSAEQVGVGQSTLSEAIKSMEHAIGGKLFERTSRRVTLTPLGETFQKEGGPAYLVLKGTINDCKRLARGEARRLMVGFLGGGFYELYGPLVAEFSRLHPEIELQFVELNYLEHFAAVAAGAVDVAFCRLPLGAPGLCHGPVVMTDPRMLCVPQDHPFAAMDLVDPELLAGERLVRVAGGAVHRDWEEYHFPHFTPGGRKIGDGPVIRTIREAIAAVMAKQGLVMLTKRAASYYATPSVVFVEIDLPPMPSALVRRVGDVRPIVLELDDLLGRMGRALATKSAGSAA